MMCMVIEGLNIIRQMVWKQALDPILAAVLNRLVRVVIQHFLKTIVVQFVFEVIG